MYGKTISSVPFIDKKKGKTKIKKWISNEMLKWIEIVKMEMVFTVVLGFIFYFCDDKNFVYFLFLFGSFTTEGIFDAIFRIYSGNSTLNSFYFTRFFFLFILHFMFWYLIFVTADFHFCAKKKIKQQQQFPIAIWKDRKRVREKEQT